MKKAVYFILILCAGSIGEASTFEFDPETPDFNGNYSLYRIASGCGPQESRALRAVTQSSERICRREGLEKGENLVPSHAPTIVHSNIESCWVGADSSAVAFASFRCVLSINN